MDKFIDQEENIDESQENDEYEVIQESEHTLIDYITAAYYGLDAVEQANMMTKDGQMRMARIKRKCLKIIDHCISEMYAEIFDNDDPE
jgi:hypothetical protein